jgi:hypothetical protein
MCENKDENIKTVRNQRKHKENYKKKEFGENSTHYKSSTKSVTTQQKLQKFYKICENSADIKSTKPVKFQQILYKIYEIGENSAETIKSLRIC